MLLASSPRSALIISSSRGLRLGRRQMRRSWSRLSQARSYGQRINAKLEKKRQSMSAQWRACNPETLRFTARDLSILSSRTTSKLSRWP